MKTYLFITFIFLTGLSSLEAFYSLDEASTIWRKSSSIHAHSAKLFLDRNKIDIALIELKKALHDQPGNRQLSSKLAEIYFKRKKYQLALDLLLPFQTVSTKKNNIYYFLGLIYDRTAQYKTAYIYYKKAFKLDPTLLKSRLRMAQLFIKKGLYYDAATHLKNILEINPDYKPAKLEFELTLKLIKENKTSVFRRGNLVITFEDFNLIRDIEEWYPYLQEKIYYMQNAFNLKNQVVWIKIVKKIRSHGNPPALYRNVDKKIYLTEDSLRRKYTSLFTHELAYLFAHKLNANKAPSWLIEGIALYFSQPNILKNMSIRKLRGDWEDLGNAFHKDKRYLNFQDIDKKLKIKLFHSFLIVKYLITRYGFENLEKFVKLFSDKKIKTSQAIWKIYHITYQKLKLDFDVFMITNHFFKT
ncbi:MAG: hypothetical protein COB02_00285 [Candidatus Cloacimonadota bacterium]|nr:MAG: hypothetical protein COB02_00285 [Candidatus Cloacimonadota bacterium]